MSDTGRATAAGDRVTLHFSLYFSSGRLVESTRDAEPVTFVIGCGALSPIFEQRLIGLPIGERRRFEISALETLALAEGEREEVFPRGEFPAEMNPAVGQLIEFRTPSGADAKGVVQIVTDHEVTIRFGNPLAGHDLVLDVEILEVTRDAI